MSADRQLPEGWHTNQDPETHETYYFSDEGKTQWHFPGDPTPDETTRRRDLPHHNIHVDLALSPQTSNDTHDASATAPPIFPAYPSASESSSAPPPPSRKSGALQCHVVPSNPLGHLIMTKFCSLLLFPFHNIICLIIWLVPQVIWYLAEFITGLVYFVNPATVHETHRVVYDLFCSIGFFPTFIFVDGCAGLVDIALHLSLMWNPSKIILREPPAVNFSPLHIITEEHKVERVLFYCRCASWALLKLFSVAWTIVGGINLALYLGVNALGQQLCFYLVDPEPSDTPNFYLGSNTGLFFLTQYTLIINFFSVGCTLFLVIAYIVFRIHWDTASLSKLK